eukprot:12257663-Ditylum_brightwellii.AAC.1
MSKVMNDEQMKATMDLLETTSLYCPRYMSLLLILRIIQLSISHGVCESTAFGFAAYSALLSRIGDVHNAYKYVTRALVPRVDLGPN